MRRPSAAQDWGSRRSRRGPRSSWPSPEKPTGSASRRCRWPRPWATQHRCCSPRSRRTCTAWSWPRPCCPCGPAARRCRRGSRARPVTGGARGAAHAAALLRPRVSLLARSTCLVACRLCRRTTPLTRRPRTGAAQWYATPSWRYGPGDRHRFCQHPANVGVGDAATLALTRETGRIPSPQVQRGLLALSGTDHHSRRRLLRACRSRIRVRFPSPLVHRDRP